MGVYRLWRDGGYALGAVLAGLTADALGLRWAIGTIGALTVFSGLLALATMRETLPARRAAPAGSELPTTPEMT